MHQFQKNLIISSLLFVFLACAGEYVVVDKADISPLLVESTVPQNGATDVPRDLSPSGAVIINFSKPIDERYVNENYFDFNCNGVRPDSKITLSEDKKVITIKLRQNVLLPEQAYCRLVISKLIKDKSGLPFYLSEGVMNQSLTGEDGGISDTNQSIVSGKEKRTGEGDYILEFVTQYEPLKITTITPEDKSIISVEKISNFDGIKVSFNKSLMEETVNLSNFILSEPVELLLSDDKKEVTIRFLNGLREGENYNYTIMPFITDTSGILLGNTFNYSFSTDYLKPQVVKITPENDSSNVDTSINQIAIEFNKDMNPSSINSYTISLLGVKDYSVRYADRSAYIEDFTLKENREYSIVVSSQVEDISGFFLEDPFYSSFKTLYNSPYIKSIFPADNATDVPTTLKNIDIEFSEEMNFENVDISFFGLTPDVEFTYKILDNRRIQLNLLKELIAGNTYTILIKKYFKDSSDISMEKDFISRFTVSTTPDNNTPSELIIYSKKITDPADDIRKGFIIEWKAPAADIINGLPSGKVKAYSLVYSEEPFDKSQFEDMTELSNIPTPSNPGDIQSITLYSFIDKDSNELPIIYNKPYYFMLRATDGNNYVYSNLLNAGILSETRELLQLSKFSGVSMKHIENFNKENIFAIGDTDDIYEGKITGSVTIFKLSNSTLTELLKLYGFSEKSLFGYRIESSDLNNDGCSDLIVSAPMDGPNSEGAIYIYPQSKNGSDCSFDPSQHIRISGGSSNSLFGFSLKKITFNQKDGLLVGAPAFQDLSTGAVFIYLNKDDLSQIPQNGDYIIYGKKSGSSFGYSSLMEDINGDGCPDLVVSAPDELTNSRGSVFVIYSLTSVSGCLIQNTDPYNADIRIDGDADYMRLGYNILNVDINGDSRPEIVLSGRDEQNTSGIIWVRNGKDGNLIKISGESGGNFGYYLDSASDFRKNGCLNSSNRSCGDILISDELKSKLYLLEGREDISTITIKDFNAFYNNSYPHSFGYSFAVFTDNQYENIIISAPFIKSFNDYVSGLYIIR